jgi:hypothetical protein
MHQRPPGLASAETHTQRVLNKLIRQIQELVKRKMLGQEYSQGEIEHIRGMVQRLMDTGKHAMALLDTLAAASE